MNPIVVQMPDGTEYSVNRLLAHERSNAKLRKSAGSEYLLYGLSFAPAKISGHNVCPSSTPGCRHSCIFTSGNGGYPSVGKCRIARALSWFQKRKQFKEKLLWELCCATKLAKRQGKRLGIRLNVFSDIMWEKTFPEVFSEFPWIQYYDYTKHYERMLQFIRGELPPNLYLTFSRSEKNEDQCIEVLDAGRNVSVPFTINKVMHPEINVPLPKRFMGRRVINGEENDLRFLDPQGVVVGIKTKGMGFWDKSGFIVDVLNKSHHVKKENYATV